VAPGRGCSGAARSRQPEEADYDKTDTLATRLADWIAQLEFDHITGGALDAAKLLILDQAGLQINGAVLPNHNRALSGPDRAILQFAAAVTSGPYLSDELFAAVRAVLSEREVVEILQVIGYC
jgi:alkylhydroperoxidase family enzyme